MLRTIELPQVGESVTEGVIGKWLVEPGQRVEKYDPLVEVVTDKVSMEAPSPYTGVFVRALAQEGETVPMGNPICEMEVEGEESPVVPAEAGTSQPDPVIPAQAGIQGARAAHEEGSGDEDVADPDPARLGGAWAMPPAHDDEQEVPPVPEAQHAFEFMDSVRSVGPTGSGEGGEGRPDALQDEALAEQAEEGAHESAAESAAEPDRSHVISPLVARLSAQYGIDLSTLRGTGTGGRITSKDLLEAVNRLSAPPQETEAAPAPVIPAEAGIQEPSVEEPVVPAEPAPVAEVESVAAAEDESPLPVGEAEAEGVPAAEAAPAPVIPAEAGIQEPPVGEPVVPAEAAPEDEPPLPEEEAEAEVIPTMEAEAEAEPTEEEAAPASVIPTEEAAAPDPLSLQGERDGVRVPWVGMEQPAPEDTAPASEDTAPASEDESPLPKGEGEGEVVPVTEAESEVTSEEEAVEDIEEALDETEEEEAPPAPVVPAEAGTSQPAPLEPTPAADTSVMPLTPVRRIIAEHMARSSREIPAAWAMVETDVTRLVRARDALRDAFEREHGVPLTYLPFAASAAAAALREHPRLNARWDDGHITLNNRVNLAVAVSTEAGLMVPVLHDADTLTIAAIAAELRRLSDSARAGTLGIDDVQGGTFTLNNTGALGSVVSVPIINHPQAAILTTEAIVKRPVVVEGDAIAVRSMMNLCLTFDHRICDGAEAAAFLSAVKARLEAVDDSIKLG